MYRLAKPWIFSLLLHAFFWGIYILNTIQPRVYVLRGFWGLMFLPVLAFVASGFSLWALNQLKATHLTRWQKILIWLLHGLGLPIMLFFCVGFSLLTFSGMISPSDYVNYPSPSGQRSVTVVSSNITCTQTVYLNHGLLMQSVGSFQIGTAKCLKNAKAEILWESGETAISWRYRDRKGTVQLPKDKN